jgi:hypothetical protein
MADQIPVYLEIGKKRIFASAIDWPGWSRSGRDEAGALQALVDSAPRFARAVASTGLAFSPPRGIADLEIVERLEGTATTDFGAPDALPAADREPLDETAAGRLDQLLAAYWAALAAAAAAAAGKELRKGPRGGGRDLAGITSHVLNAEASYLRRLAQKPELDDEDELAVSIQRMRQAETAALGAAVRGEIPERGPRGGTIWPPRYFARRAGWHILDHAWEIEDRILS